MNTDKKIIGKSRLLLGIILTAGLFWFNGSGRVKAAPSPIFVQFKTENISLLENVAGTKVYFAFTNINDANAPAVSHGNINIHYQITGTAQPSDYVFNNQPNVTAGIVQVPAGTGNFGVALKQNNDAIFENNETVVITITQVVHVNNSTTLKIGKIRDFRHTILNDDAATTNLNIAAVSDVSATSRIYGPESFGVQLGKWRMAATGEDVVLNKITLQAVYANGSGPATNLGTFGTLSLYDGSTILATGNYINGDVVFNGLSSVIPANNSKAFTLKGSTNQSGILASNTVVAFTIKSDNNSDMEARANSSGALLGTADINHNASVNNGVPEFSFAASTPYLFHDAYPIINSVSLGNTLSLDTHAKIFKFNITNAGTRDLRLSSATVSVNVYGLAAGTIGEFGLYEDNGVGGLSTYTIAQNNMVINSTSNLARVSFDSTNDNLNASGQGWLENFVIAPGATRTLIVTANTTNVLSGLSSGNIIVFTKIAGSTGWNGAAWNTGDLVYYYTPVNVSEQGPFSASDSYDVTAPSLTYSF